MNDLVLEVKLSPRFSRNSVSEEKKVMTSMRSFSLLMMMITFACFVEPLKVPPQVNRPPKIVLQSRDVVYAIPRLTIVLRCAANARPSVSSERGYMWEKNDKFLTVLSEEDKAPPGSIVMKEKNGTITFLGSENLDEEELKQYEGVYQCFATNKLGTAITRPITVKVAEVPYQRPKNEIISVREGDSLKLPCNYSNYDALEIRWTSSASVNILSERISQSPNGNLVFANVIADSEDGDEFWCTVKDLATRKSTDGTHFTLRVDRSDPVIGKPAEIVTPQEQNEHVTVLRGEDLQLSCITIGKPTPSVQWTALSGSWPKERTTFEDFNHTVVISNVSASDEGPYRCTASNELEKQVMKVITVKVDAKPYFASEDRRPHDTITVPGGNVTIKCQPDGIPTPTVEWRVNGFPMENLLPMDNRVVRSNRIQLKNLRKDESAVYQCISSNKHDSVLEQAYVNVLTWKPVVLKENKLVYQQIEDGNIEMKCNFFGSPPPSVTWRQNGTDVTTMNRFSVKKEKYLQIENLQQSDSGVYTCEANNPYGKASLDITLNVLQPTTLRFDADAEVQVGGSVVLKVEVVKDLKSPGRNHVKWSKENAEVGHGRALMISNAEFGDAGIYKVSVTTALDHANGYITLTVTDKPLPPNNFTFTTPDFDDPMRITFTWTPGLDNFSPILDYKIEFEEDVYQPGLWQTLEDSIDGSATSSQLSLSPGVNYRFRAWARNSVGWSQNSSSTTRRYRTPDGYPDNPTGVEGEGTMPGTILVSWDAVRGLNQNAPGFGYLVNYRPADSEGGWMLEDVSAEDTSLEIIGTAPYKPYLVRLQSYNDVGNAENATTPIIVYTGEDVPIAAPQHVGVSTNDHTPTKVVVTWDRVPQQQVRGKVLGYVVACRKVGENDVLTKRFGNKETGKVDKLLPNTEYAFTVSVFNKKGNGPPSNSVIQTTPKGAPAQGTVAITVDIRQANVTWYPTIGIQSETILVQYTKSKGQQWISTHTYEVNQAPVSVIISDLEPEAIYYFRVVSTNTHGSSTSAIHAVKIISATAELEAGGMNPVWLIVILCMVGLLLIVVLIIYLIKRRKGKKYPVSEKERHHNGSHPMYGDLGLYSDETDDVKKPLTESVNPNNNANLKTHPGGVPLQARRSFGGDSVEAFVVADPNEFNEDGSFIGQYGVISSNKPTSPNGGEISSSALPKGDAV